MDLLIPGPAFGVQLVARDGRLESMKWSFLQRGTSLSASAASAGQQRPGALGPNSAFVCVREAHQNELPQTGRGKRGA